MPSHKIHMYIAKRVNETLNMNLDNLMLGSVLPDLTIDRNHKLSHFQADGHGYDNLANPDKFLLKYKDKLDNEIMIGYLIHILTDRFYNKYVFDNYIIFDNNYAIGIKKDNEIIYPEHRLIWKYKKNDFWKYDEYLINNGYISKFKNINVINDIPDLGDVKYDKEFLQQYIINANMDVDDPSRIKIDNYIFMNKEQLDKVLDLCVLYIIDYLKNIKDVKNNEYSCNNG